MIASYQAVWQSPDEINGGISVGGEYTGWSETPLDHDAGRHHQRSSLTDDGNPRGSATQFTQLTQPNVSMENRGILRQSNKLRICVRGT